jgi:hypothetical protein
VDGAGADDDEQAVILAVENLAQQVAPVGDSLAGLVGIGSLAWISAGVGMLSKETLMFSMLGVVI